MLLLSSCIGFSKAVAVPITPSLGSGSVTFLELEDLTQTLTPRSQLQFESITNAIEVCLKCFHTMTSHFHALCYCWVL